MRSTKYSIAVFIPTIAGVLLSLSTIILLVLKLVAKQPINLVVESINTCVAIIGLAVATWVGLSISNTVERRDLENIDRKQHEIDSWIVLQKSINRNFFLDELSKNTSNPIAKDFCARFSNLPLDEEKDYLLLAEIEQNVSRVVQMHNTGTSDPEIRNAIDNTKSILDRLCPGEDATIQAYLDYCKATLEYHLGYHVHTQQESHFVLAIQLFEKYAKEVGISLIDSFEYEELSAYVNRAKEEQLDELKAYIFNTLGDAYRFTNSPDSSTKAARYCSFACKYSKNNESPKNKYLRNLGCALERLQAEKGEISDEAFILIKQNYVDSLKGSRPNSKNFKVILSLLDKHINKKLNIGFNGRKDTAYNSSEFIIKWAAVKTAHGEIDDLLAEMKKYADQAKQLFPQDPVGYQYKGVYYWHKYASIMVDIQTGGNCPAKAAEHYKQRAGREKDIVNHLLSEDRVIQLQ